MAPQAGGSGGRNSQVPAAKGPICRWGSASWASRPVQHPAFGSEGAVRRLRLRKLGVLVGEFPETGGEVADGGVRLRDRESALVGSHVTSMPLGAVDRSLRPHKRHESVHIPLLCRLVRSPSPSEHTKRHDDVHVALPCRLVCPTGRLSHTIRHQIPHTSRPCRLVWPSPLSDRTKRHLVPHTSYPCRFVYPRGRFDRTRRHLVPHHAIRAVW